MNLLYVYKSGLTIESVKFKGKNVSCLKADLTFFYPPVVFLSNY